MEFEYLVGHSKRFLVSGGGGRRVVCLKGGGTLVYGY